MWVNPPPPPLCPPGSGWSQEGTWRCGLPVRGECLNTGVWWGWAGASALLCGCCAPTSGLSFPMLVSSCLKQNVKQPFEIHFETWCLYEKSFFNQNVQLGCSVSAYERCRKVTCVFRMWTSDHMCNCVVSFPTSLFTVRVYVYAKTEPLGQHAGISELFLLINLMFLKPLAPVVWPRGDVWPDS